MIDRFEVAATDWTLNGTFAAEDYHSEGKAWDAAVKYAHELIDRGHALEEIKIIEFEGDSAIEIRSHLEWFAE